MFNSLIIPGDPTSFRQKNRSKYHERAKEKKNRRGLFICYRQITLHFDDFFYIGVVFRFPLKLLISNLLENPVCMYDDLKVHNDNKEYK